MARSCEERRALKLWWSRAGPGTLGNATPSSPPAWTTEQFKAVLRLIATTPYHAVRQRELKQALGSSGTAALKSMVEYNLLAVRTASPLAHDLPLEVYVKDGEEDAVVTMQSPGALYVVLRMHKRGALAPSVQAPPVKNGAVKNTAFVWVAAIALNGVLIFQIK